MSRRRHRRVPPLAAVALVVLAGAAGTALAVDSGRDSARPRGEPAAPAIGRERAFPDRVRAIVRRLDATRLEGRRRLAGARTALGQADAARRIGRAWRTAAGRMEPLERRHLSSAGLAAALRGTARMYGSLAAAARVGDRRRFTAMRAAVGRSEQAVDRTLDRVVPGDASR